MIRFLTGKTVAFALLKIIKEKRIRHEATKVAKQIDKMTESAFGEKQSEKIQEIIENGLQLFVDTVIKELRRDRKK